MRDSDNSNLKKQLLYHLACGAYEHQQSVEHSQLSAQHGTKSQEYFETARQLAEVIARPAASTGTCPRDDDERRVDPTPRPRRRLPGFKTAQHAELVKKAACGVPLLVLTLLTTGGLTLNVEGKDCGVNPQRGQLMTLISAAPIGPDGLAGWRQESEVREAITTNGRKPMSEQSFEKLVSHLRSDLWQEDINPELIQRTNGMIRFATAEVRTVET